MLSAATVLSWAAEIVAHSAEHKNLIIFFLVRDVSAPCFRGYDHILSLTFAMPIKMESCCITGLQSAMIMERIPLLPLCFHLATSFKEHCQGWSKV